MKESGVKVGDIARHFGIAVSTTYRLMDRRNDTPSGVCECGCGTPTRVDQANWTANRFAPGHNARHSSRAIRGADYIVDERGCWVWQKSLHAKGYGHMNRDGHVIAHRWSYERHKGPIPAGMQLDHLCGTRACINPDHLEPVTNAENSRRARARKANGPGD